ncbi:MAG: succinyldiaminopimelate transaminase [Gammaproteobacteria bacterium]|nr:succinyldiaminopimelate transaminase [Gammaproteobacteria bacterium]MDE2345591.1 succinyldiaminopimelate transaminase [Gammaproteobacteria bacterium]
MNPDLDKLFPYPFERLAKLKDGITPPSHLAHIAMSIGEPKHAPPAFVLQALRDNLAGLGAYPMAKGLPELRTAIARWLTHRFKLSPGRINPDRHVLPVSGTREGLFAFAQAVMDRAQRPLVLMPNPFYQIYEGAAFLAGAEPYYLNTIAENGFLPDLESVPQQVWQRCQLLYICTPGNPTGAIMDGAYLRQVLKLADRHDFIVASDECYAEIYLDEAKPPPGLLQICEESGRHDFRRCVVFHSLSKRSSLPGLRSGFVAGDAAVLEKFLIYRTYHGCALPLPVQLASVRAWDDEQHVLMNRRLYQQKFQACMQILAPVMDVHYPPAAFYLWPKTQLDDERFARELYARQNLSVLPGSYLSRPTSSGDPGKNRVRISLVPALAECIEAAQRIRAYVESI